MLREMKNPLIKFSQYEAYGDLDQIPQEQRFPRIKQLVNELEPLRKNTLKFCVEFFREVVSYAEYNLMTAYNVAVTVSPNIFRSLNDRAEDILKHAVYYDALMQMIEKYEELFDESSDYQVDQKHLGAVGKQLSPLEQAILEQPEENEDEEENDMMAQMEKANQDYDADLLAAAKQADLNFKRISSNYPSSVSYSSKRGEAAVEVEER